MSLKSIYWFDKLGKELNDRVGKKCANLGEMTKRGMRVPPGFALSLDVYQDFMDGSRAAVEIREYLRDAFPDGLQTIADFQESSKSIRAIVESKEIPDEIREDILVHYSGLCKKVGMDNVAVSVRSAGVVSHPGQYETILNVKGEKPLINEIKRVWSSTFVARAISYRVQEGLPVENDPIGVAILKMVHARSAGICFTADPNTGDDSVVIIEGNWGLGESVVSGAATPDRFTVLKKNLEIKGKTICKKLQKVSFSENGTIEEEIKHKEQEIPCLTDEEVIELARSAISLEKQLGVPQDMEWAVDEDFQGIESIFWLQTRPAVISAKANPLDMVIDLLIDSGKV